MAEEHSEPHPRQGPFGALLVVACFVLAPFVAFLADNAGGAVGAWHVLRYPVAGLAILVPASLLLWLLRGQRAVERATLLAAVVLLATFNYRNLSGILETAGMRTALRLLVWLALLLVLAGLALYVGHRRDVLRFVGVAGTLLVLVPGVQYALASDWGSAQQAARANGSPGASFVETPDIYYVVPDGYGRADVLAEMVGFDNDPFLDALRGRGFSVLDEASANYPLTYLSVAATLEMDYVVEASPDALEGGRGPYYDLLRGGSRLHERLRAEGYHHVQAPPGTWAGSACSGSEELCVEAVSRRGVGTLLGEAEWALLQLTPVGAVLEAFLTDWLDRPFADPSHVVRTVEAADLGGPTFAMIHMLQPHPPFMWSHDCRPSPPEIQDLRSWASDHGDAYIEAMECTNRKLLAMLDLLDPDAVVVVLADHGSGFRQQWSDPFEEWVPETIRERYPVLGALRLPDRCEDPPPDLSAVNAFRIVLACLEGTEQNLREDRWFFASYNSDEVREMTAPPWSREAGNG